MLKKVMAIAVAGILCITFPFVFGGDEKGINATDIGSERTINETAVVVSKENPFYPLIATPISVYYDNGQHVAPLLVQDFTNPSKPVQRFKEMYGLSNPIYVVGETPESASIRLATEIWVQSDAALLMRQDNDGYNLGIVAVPLASYLNIPVFVTNDTDNVKGTLKELGVKSTFVCGNIAGYGETERFASVEEINDYILNVLNDGFGGCGYITMANPLDITAPEVLDSVSYNFEDSTSSVAILPAQSFHALLSEQLTKTYKFVVPEDYHNARIKLDLINKNSENVTELGDGIFLMVTSPDENTYVYTATGAGIPKVDINGDITSDRVHYETIVYDKPGEYSATVIGRWFASVEGEYELNITIEKIDTTIMPTMKSLSSMSPYLTAYHRGIVFAKPEFAFGGNESMTSEGGIYQPGDNPALIDIANAHTMTIHNEFNDLLAKIANISHDDIEALRSYYTENPIYIAIMADTNMVPMYYYRNPDSAYLMGWGVPSDYIWGDVDLRDGDVENDTYSYYPFQENAVGRVTGYDSEDCSALIARTIYYDDIIQNLGDWKNNATVQTGCGLEFQKVPVMTTLSNMISGGDEPTKWPTGESMFANLHITNDLEESGFNVKNTFLLESQREGFSNLKDVGRKYITFPHLLEAMSGEDAVHGGENQRNSNIIFTFAHGFYYLYEAGDILMDARGFPPFTTMSRFYYMGSGLSSKGTYDVRSIVNSEYNPSVLFVESCIVGRTDGLMPQNTLSQAYMHAGMNGMVAATRVTADPGYLEPGLIFKGFGAKGFVNATLNLLLDDEYPDVHFGAVIAQDFIMDMTHGDNTTGMALRNAKNLYLPKDANSTFMWTPPLPFTTGERTIDRMIEEKMHQSMSDEGRFMDKKYHCLHEFTLYGDPAFNPWNP